MSSLHVRAQRPPRPRPEQIVPQRPVILHGHAGPVVDLAVFSDAAHVVSIDAAGELRLWRLGEPTSIAHLQTHVDRPQAVCFLAHDHEVAAGGKDGVVRLWDGGGKRPASKLEMPGRRAVLDILRSPCGQFIAVTAGFPADTDHLVMVWAMAHLEGAPIWSERLVGLPRFLLQEGASKIVLSHTTSTTAEAYRITAHEAASGRELWGLAAPAPLIAAADNGTLAVYRDGDVSLAVPHGHVRHLCGVEVTRADLAPDGETLAAGTHNEVRFYHCPSGRMFFTGKHAGLVSSAAFTPDGASVVSAGQDRTLRVWPIHGLVKG